MTRSLICNGVIMHLSQAAAHYMILFLFQAKGYWDCLSLIAFVLSIIFIFSSFIFICVCMFLFYYSPYSDEPFECWKMLSCFILFSIFNLICQNLKLLFLDLIIFIQLLQFILAISWIALFYTYNGFFKFSSLSKIYAAMKKSLII